MYVCVLGEREHDNKKEVEFIVDRFNQSAKAETWPQIPKNAITVSPQVNRYEVHSGDRSSQHD